MKRYATKRVYQVRCKSGIMGWRTRLQNNYSDLGEWEHQSDTWGLCFRLGYASPRAAWVANPIIEGSVNAGDYRVSEIS